MDSEKVEVQCEQCGKSFDMSITEYEHIMETRSPIICVDCYDNFLKTEKLSVSRCEYKIITIDENDFNTLGRDGWELVIVNNERAYFKRECFKEGE